MGAHNPTRDFSYVKDTVTGFIAALEAESIFGETINLGTNQEMSIKAMAETIANLMGKEIEFSLDPKRIRPPKSEVNRLRADNRKALKLLNWKPKYIGQKGLKIALTETIDWFLDETNLKKYNYDRYNI